MSRVVKLFTDDIIKELGTYQPSAFHTNPDLVWNEALMDENHRKIVDIIRKKLEGVVIVFHNDIIDLSTRVTSYAIVKNVEWSDHGWAKINVRLKDIEEGKHFYSPDSDSDHEYVWKVNIQTIPV